MDLTPLYPWFVLIHVLSAFGFIALHGTSMVVVFRLRSERDLVRVRALLDVSIASVLLMYLFILILLVSGIIAGIIGAWWTSGRLWIWASLILLVAIFFYIELPRHAVLRAAPAGRGTAGPGPGQGFPASEPDPTRLATLLADRRTAWELLIIGGGGLALLIWMMEMKPF